MQVLMVSVPVSRLAPAPAPHAAAHLGTIGPNSVLQTLQAAAELQGTAFYAAVARRAKLPATGPDAMIPEAHFIRLVEALRASLPWQQSEAILRRAGTYTADYVAANRIPAFFRRLLGILPPRIGLPLLLNAFRRHAWTFAGSGTFECTGPYPGTIVLTGSPTCAHSPQATQAGAYYEAAFEGLLRLAAPGATVRETACQARGDADCRYSIQIEGTRARGENPCVSS